MHEQVVAQVDVRLERRQPLLADRREAEHGLQPVALAVLQRREAELAADPHEHHAAGHADLVVRLLPRLEVRVLGADLRDRVGARHPDRVGLDACREQPVPLLAPHPDLLGGVVGCRGALGGLAHRAILPAQVSCTRWLIRHTGCSGSRSSARSRIGDECVSPPTDR